MDFARLAGIMLVSLASPTPARYALLEFNAEKQ
jgi:hypothetical protein